MTIADLIRDSRVENDMTRTALAAAVEVSRSLISHVENNGYIPSASVCARLAVTLNIDVDQVCGLAGHVAPDLATALITDPAKAHAARRALSLR